MDLKRESIITFYSSCSNRSCNSQKTELSEKKIDITNLKINQSLLNKKKEIKKNPTNYFFKKKKKIHKIEKTNKNKKTPEFKKLPKPLKKQNFIKFSSKRNNRNFRFYKLEEDKIFFKKNLEKKLHKNYFDNDIDSDSEIVKEAIWFNFKNFAKETLLYV